MKIGISERDKNSIFALLTIALVTVVFLAMFFPEIINYKYNMSNMTDKKDEIASIAYQLSLNENLINKLTVDIGGKLEKINEIEGEVKEIDSKIHIDNFNIHIPSLLISLEREANSRNLDLLILYNMLNIDASKQLLSNDDLSGLLDLLTGGDDNPVAEATPPAVSVDEDETDEVNDPNDEDTPQLDGEFEIVDNENNGLTHARVPIIVKGDFIDVRNFVRSLDELDFVEAARIDVLSEGEDVVASILLNIYYKEGDIN